MKAEKAEFKDEVFEITINHDLRPNDYRVYKGRIVVDGSILSQRNELHLRAKAFMARRGIPIFTCALRMFLYIFRRQDPMRPFFGDGDNFVKWVADALQGAVYVNDCQIQEYHIFKFKANSPCLQVRIEPFLLVNPPVAKLVTKR